MQDDLFQRQPPGFTPNAYDPTKGRDKVRAIVIVTLLLAMLVVIAIYLAAAWKLAGDPFKQTKDAFNVVLPVISTAFGSALGFYFGKETNK